MTSPVLRANLTTAPSRMGGWLWDIVVRALDTVFSRVQRLIGAERMPYIFILPNFLIFTIFILTPVVLNGVYAFTGGTDFFLAERNYVGGQNFSQIFTCDSFLDPSSCREDIFWKAVYNTAGYVVATVLLTVGAALLSAVILNRDIVARGFFRSVFFYPVLLSPIVVALIWKWILQENGAFNAVLESAGLGKVPFLTDATWARFWVIMISVWAYMGFYTLILLAGLQGIPSEFYEAAKVDGASAWQSFRRITLPLLRPTMLVVVILAVIRSVQVFDIIIAFTDGGPGTATYSVVQYIYETGFASPARRFGMASAASLLMAGVLVVATLAQLRFNRDDQS